MFACEFTSLDEGFVESHISRDTSQMWDSRDSFHGKSFLEMRDARGSPGQFPFRNQHRGHFGTPYAFS